MSLEEQLRAELYVARVARGGDAPERGRAEEVVGQVQVRVVEEVEELRAQLQAHALAERSVLHERRVDVVITRPRHDVAPGVAERARRGEREGRRVEPLLRRARPGVRVADEVRAVVRAEAERRAARAA